MKRFAQRGDRRAFEQLAGRWDRRVFGFLAKACGSLEAAEDLRQEVFLRLYRHGGRYDPRYPFTTWLFRIAANVLSTWRAKQARARERGDGQTGHPGLEFADESPNPRERLAAGETRAAIREALAGLEVEERELLLLRFDLELSYPEIGRLKQMPETTVKSRVYKLLERLRVDLEHLQEPQRSQR